MLTFKTFAPSKKSAKRLKNKPQAGRKYFQSISLGKFDDIEGGVSCRFFRVTWLVLEFFSSREFSRFLPLFWTPDAPLGRIFQRESQLISLDLSGEIQAYPFPCKINFLDFYCLVSPSWFQPGRGREVSSNSKKCFCLCQDASLW